MGRDGGSAGLCSGSRSVPLGCVGPASTRLIHDWVSARVKTHRLTPCKHTGGCVGVDETGYFVGFGKLQLVAAFTFPPSQVQMCLKARLPQKMERKIAIKLRCIECLEWAGEFRTKEIVRRCLFPISITTLTGWSKGRFRSPLTICNGTSQKLCWSGLMCSQTSHL